MVNDERHPDRTQLRPDAVFLDYELPGELIAQAPCPERDHSRLMRLDRCSGAIAHHHFFELPELLRPGDLLILNDTRVLPARLLGKRRATGGKWEGLFLGVTANGCWDMMCQTRGKLAAGDIIDVGGAEASLELRLIEKSPEGRWLARPDRAGHFAEVLQQYGHVPLPPYIRKGAAEAADRERYQTVYARNAGAVAAPTAGLHFTPDLFDKLKERGIDWAHVTLHVGLGTFQPVQVEDYRAHKMHAECGELSETTVKAIAACRARGGRIVAVGTTSVRVLETVAATGPVRPWAGATTLYIHPPYEFRVVDALVTNFHLPRTTLLLMVGAFAGGALLRSAYAAAIASQYRFYSYGDAMLIV
ncbi:MAG: tRNA preQ1(34) S-adenosylmethionine ribosyltransferase-isomerase QueA [Planctomycetes bacterium]|nr:tRNA preQ1(34) S-adenosylmethionine ribosyltransferase-isomerase QueA [Planctomycetota bacterium]